MVYQELSKLFAKEAFGQLHNWNPTSKEGKAAKAIAHGVVAEVSARMAGNKPGSGFYAGATNEALIGEIQKIAKEKPDVAQSLSALLGAAVNGSLGYSPVTGAAEAQYGTKWNANQVEPNMKRILNDIESTGIYVNSKGEKIYISKLYKDNSTVEYMVITTENEKGERITSVLDKDYNFIDVDITGGTLNLFKSDYDLRKRNKVDITLYDDYITGKDRLNDFSPTKTVLTVKVKEDVGNLKYTPNFYMKKEDRPLEVSSKVIESYMGTTFWGMSAEHYGSSGVQKLFKKMTPGYVRSGTRAIINSGSRAIGGYASGAALLVAAKIDNEMTFKGHPDLIAKANMLDETAYGLGVVTSLGAAGATAGTFGTGAPISYTASVGVNISYGLFVEYQKYKLLKEKKKEISMWGYKGLFLCWFIITLCIYTKIYILAWTNNRGYKEMSLNMCFPKLFKTFIVISYFYIGLLGYVFWFIDDFMIIMSSTILGVILIYLSGMIITIQKKSSPQYHNGKKLARYMLLYPFIAIVLYLWLKYNGLLF